MKQAAERFAVASAPALDVLAGGGESLDPFSVIREAEAMGRFVEDRWYRADHDEHAFPDIARQALDLHAPRHLDPAKVTAWALATDDFPEQADVGSRFGEPSLTLYSGEGFQIDLLFWLDGTTSIHRHMFSGAFRLLLGSSLHSEFCFATQRRVNSRLQLGDLRLTRVELLEEGATRSILAGNGLIHSAFHLDRPSVTLVIRTREEPDTAPQYQYHRPGIALDEGAQGAAFRKRIQLLRMLQRLKHPAFADSMRTLLRRSNLETTVRLLLHTELMGAEGMREELANQAPRFRSDFDWLLPAFDHVQRTGALVTWRRVLDRLDLRFLLGLVLSSPGRKHIVRLVQQRHGHDAVPRIVSCVRQVVEIQRQVSELPAIVDRNLGEPDLATLERVLADGARESGDDASLERFRESALLRELLA
jgi:hypothetical protein